MARLENNPLSDDEWREEDEWGNPVQDVSAYIPTEQDEVVDSAEDSWREEDEYGQPLHPELEERVPEEFDSDSEKGNFWDALKVSHYSNERGRHHQYARDMASSEEKPPLNVFEAAWKLPKMLQTILSEGPNPMNIVGLAEREGKKMVASQMPEAKKAFVQEELNKSEMFSEKAAAIPMSDALTSFFDEESETSVWDAVRANPEIIVELGARSGAPIVEMMRDSALMARGVGMAGYGRVAKGLAGMYGFGKGSYRVDYASTLIGEMAADGVDVADAQQVIDYMKTQKFKEAEVRSLKRGVFVAGTDSLSYLFGGKMTTGFIKNALGRELANLGIQIPLGAGLGMVAETGGQLAQGVDELKKREIWAEGLGDLVTAGPQSIQASLSGGRQMLKDRADVKARKEGSGLLDELEQNETDTEQLGADIEELQKMNGEELADYQQQVRDDVASRGGDQLEQEIAAAEAGNEAGQVLDSEVETLKRLYEQRARADEEARYGFEEQQKEDAAREKTQKEAAEKYETGQKQIAADKQAAEDKAQLSEKVESDLARTERIQDAQAARTEEIKEATVRKQTASDKADMQLRKLRKRRQELGLEPKGELEGVSPYPSAPTVEAHKGKKPKSNAMAEALARASKEAAAKAEAKAELGTEPVVPSKTDTGKPVRVTKKGDGKRILFRKGEEGASKRLVEEIKNKEGFTVNNDTGQPVKKGFSVGQGMEEIIEGEVTDVQLDAFREKFAKELADPTNVLGAWYDKKSGKTFLDVSKVFENRAEAMAAGVTNKELAIYDLEKGEEIRLDEAEEIEAAPAPEKAPTSFETKKMKVSDLENVKGDPQRKSPAEMAEFVKKIQSGEIKPNIIVKTKEGVPSRIVEGNHTLRVLRQLGITDVDVKIQEGVADEGRNFHNFFASITKGLAGKSSTGKEYTPVITLKVSEGLRSFVDSYTKFRGNFDDHIAFSIPGFKEVQISVGTALAKVYGKGANILDIGASEGSFVKAITSESGAHTIALDPNEAMQDTFNATPVEGSEYSRTAFGTREQQGALAWPADEDGPATNYFDPMGEKFDAVHEAMVFQFMSPDRTTQINGVKQLLKADGVAIFEEKMFTNAQEANESKKNEYKRQYFEEKEMTKKAAEILEGMDENTVHQETLEQTLKNNFKNVVQFWDSGNFKGYIASDSKTAADNMVSAIGDTSSEFSTTATPRKVESPQKVRGDVQLRRVDKVSKKVDKAEAEVVVKDLNDKLPGLKINLLETPYSLPETLFNTVMNEFGAAGMGARGMIDTKTGEIYVFSKNHSSLEGLVETIMHEGVGHKGLRVLFNEEQKNELLDSVFANGDQTALKRIAKSYGLDLSKVDEQRLIADEYIAEMAEKNIDAPIMQRVIDAVRRVLKSLGLLDTWTDADIKALLRRTRSALKNGKPLSKIKLRTEMEVEETGEVVTVEQTASVALRQLDKRINVLKKLKDCVK